MPIRDQLLALTDGLRRLKSGGQRAVSVSDETLALLREAVVVEQARAEAGTEKMISMGKEGEPLSIPTEPPLVQLPAGDKQTRWNALHALVLNHPVCRAHVRPGKKIVLGVGSLGAKIFFCGEAPGAEEEMQGEPFVGPAGQLLTQIGRAHV